MVLEYFEWNYMVSIFGLRLMNTKNAAPPHRTFYRWFLFYICRVNMLINICDRGPVSTINHRPNGKTLTVNNIHIRIHYSYSSLWHPLTNAEFNISACVFYLAASVSYHIAFAYINNDHVLIQSKPLGPGCDLLIRRYLECNARTWKILIKFKSN